MDHESTGQKAQHMEEQFFQGASGIQKQFEQMPSSFYYWAVLGSIAASALLMLMGKNRLAVFVGLWPPTLLNMGLFNKILRPSHEIER
jgi:hypothetical protein